MAAINLTVHLKYDEVVERLKSDGWVIPVRCKDCKHSEPWYKDKYRCFLWVETGIDVFEDGFCSYGERKGGDE